MTDDKTPTQEPGTSDEDSLLDSLRAAGSSLGGIVGEFTQAYKKDRENSTEETGSHALHDPVEEKDTTAAQIRAAGAHARQTFREGSGLGAVKDAAGTFAGHAESIARDVAGSVVAAADATRESGRVDEVGGALGKVRNSVGGTLGKVRGRFGAATADDEGTGTGTDGATGSEDGDTAVIIEGEVISAETTETPVDEKDR